MPDYRFAPLPSNSSIASFVTIAVCVWFLVAAAAILDDPVSPYTQRELRQARHSAGEVAIAPQAHFSIVVQAHRGGWSRNPLRADLAPGP